jgi:WD40-like Beta Propeller Repeat
MTGDSPLPHRVPPPKESLPGPENRRLKRAYRFLWNPLWRLGTKPEDCSCTPTGRSSLTTRTFVAGLKRLSENPEKETCKENRGGPAVTTPRWSPDGTRIDFDSNKAGEFDIWVVGANRGNPQEMTTNPANDGNPNWSHDNRWIYDRKMNQARFPSY